MVANLFGVDGTAIEKTLESLSKDGIEGFINIKVENTVSKSKGDTVFKAVYWIGSACSSFN
jgi:hypothetical protein